MCRRLPSVLLPRTSWPYTAAVRYALIGLVLLLCTGCVERRIYVRSEPPGADVTSMAKKWARRGLRTTRTARFT